MKVPKFKSVDEELEFWSTHSALDFMSEGEEVEIDASRARELRNRRETRQISLRVSCHIIDSIKQRAQGLGVPYQTLMQIWLAERLETESARMQALAARQVGASVPPPEESGERHQPKLTKREVEVLALMLAGKTLQEISSELTISKRTIEFHLARIYEKLKVASAESPSDSLRASADRLALSF